jgi:uncharacterized protein YjbI with pentapeptide repeats
VLAAATLQSANLQGTLLNGVDLRGADLRNAILTSTDAAGNPIPADLSTARYDSTTQFPAGFSPELPAPP